MDYFHQKKKTPIDPYIQPRISWLLFFSCKNIAIRQTEINEEKNPKGFYNPISWTVIYRWCCCCHYRIFASIFLLFVDKGTKRKKNRRQNTIKTKKSLKQLKTDNEQTKHERYTNRNRHVIRTYISKEKETLRLVLITSWSHWEYDCSTSNTTNGLLIECAGSVIELETE